MGLWSWKTQPNSHAQRKFIELILDRTGKYANWDPPSEIQVCRCSLNTHLLHVDLEQIGSYGRIDKDTGNLNVEGNIYSDNFKQFLIEAGINPESDEHHAKDCPDESEFKTWSKNVKCIDMNADAQA